MIYCLCKELGFLHWNLWGLERNILFLAFCCANLIPRLCQSGITVRQYVWQSKWRDCKSGYLLEMPQILHITNVISSELIPGAALKSMDFFSFPVTAVASKTGCNFLMQEMLPPWMIYACLDYGLCPSVLTGFLSSPVQTALNPLRCRFVVNVDEGLWDTSRCDLFISCCDSSDVADGEEMSSVQSGCSFPACVSGKELLEVVWKLSLGSCCFPEIER